MTQKTFNYFSWGLVIVLSAAAVYVWGDSNSWTLSGLSLYKWFPLFGLIAWLLMATHYFTGAFRILTPSLKRAPGYKKITYYAVLASLLLHPGLLAYAQFNNGNGLPPVSFIDYVGESLKLAVALGSFSLVLFLSFEVFMRMKQKSIVQNYWWAVSISQSLAMTLIWIHALRLGSHITDGWFGVVWIMLGLALLPCFYLVHLSDFRQK